MKPWYAMIASYLTIQVFAVYGSLLVFESVENSFTRFYNTQVVE